MKIKALSVAAIAVCAIAGSAQATELVSNGGFETGDFTGWTLFGNPGFRFVTTGTFYPHTGSFGAGFGAIGSEGGVSQTLTTVSAGQTVHISYWLRNSGGDPNSFTFSLGGSTFATATDIGGFDYTLFEFDVVAPSDAPELSFGFRQDPSFFGFDDVSATVAVPFPAAGGIGLAGMALVGMRRRRTA